MPLPGCGNLPHRERQANFLEFPPVPILHAMSQTHIATLYLDYFGEVRRFLARRLPCLESAAELANEVFVRRLTASRPVDNERAFLLRIAENLAHDHFRAHGDVHSRCVDIDDCHDLASEAPSPERHAIARQQVRLLRQAIEELPPRCREVFIRHRFDETPQKTLASEYGISLSAIEKLLVRALVHLRLRLHWS